MRYIVKKWGMIFTTKRTLYHTVTNKYIISFFILNDFQRDDFEYAASLCILKLSLLLKSISAYGTTIIYDICIS